MILEILNLLLLKLDITSLQEKEFIDTILLDEDII